MSLALSKGNKEGPSQPAPFVVDLDGALLQSDLKWEAAIAYIRGQPLRMLNAVTWLIPSLRKAAAASDIDVSVLPYDPEILSSISAAREAGRAVILATASPRTLAERIGKYLQVDEVLATNATRPMRDVLVDRYGEGGFDFARSARANRSGLRDWAQALRLHQWVKNALIFVPLLAAHKLANFELLRQDLIAFALFGMCASSVYLLNDLLDLEDDRHHSSKRHRPFASGRLSIKAGLVALVALLVAAFAAALALLPWQFAGALGIYYLLTLSYSLSFKKHMALDVIALALLYTVRVIAGGAALGLPLTFWLLAFSLFMFLSLALAKRYAELRDALRRGRTEQTRGRGYDPKDLEMISSLGAASGYQAVMVLALYVRDQGTIALYSHPEIIWLACPVLLFWITRVWMLTHRGQMHDDPVIFAVRDRISQVAGALFCLVFLAAT